MWPSHTTLVTGIPIPPFVPPPPPFLRATLEEIQDAQVLLHIVDISHPHAQAQAEAVMRVLAELEVDSSIPMITAWNKVDRCPDPAEVCVGGGEGGLCDDECSRLEN